jgi:hypothetical protein
MVCYIGQQRFLAVSSFLSYSSNYCLRFSAFAGAIFKVGQSTYQLVNIPIHTDIAKAIDVPRLYGSETSASL